MVHNIYMMCTCRGGRPRRDTFIRHNKDLILRDQLFDNLALPLQHYHNHVCFEGSLSCFSVISLYLGHVLNPPLSFVCYFVQLSMLRIWPLSINYKKILQSIPFIILVNIQIHNHCEFSIWHLRHLTFFFLRRNNV